MDTIRELEEKLREAKLKEAWNSLQVRYQNLKTKYLGKAFGSCALGYNNLHKYRNKIFIQIIYIEDMFISDNCINFTKIETFEDYKKYNGEDVSIYYSGEGMNINKGDNGVSLNKYNIVHSKVDPYSFSDCGYEISLEKYESLKKLIGGSIDNVFTLSYKNIGFDSLEKSECEDILKKHGAKLIRLTDSELYTLVSENNPFVYGNNLLVNDMSEEILNDLLKKYKDLDSKDTNYYLWGERISRSGIYEIKIKNIENILKKFHNI